MANQNVYNEKLVSIARQATNIDNEYSDNLKLQKYQDSSLSHLSFTTGLMMNIMNRIGENNDFKFDLIDEIATLRGRKDTVKFSFDSISNDNEIEFSKETWDKIKYNKVSVVPFESYKATRGLNAYDIKNTVYFLWCLATEYPVLDLYAMNKIIMPRMLNLYTIDPMFKLHEGLLSKVKHYLVSLAINMKVNKYENKIMISPCFDYESSKDWKRIVKEQFPEIIMIEDQLDETQIRNNETMDFLMQQYMDSMRDNLVKRSIWFRCKTCTNIEDTNKWTREQWNEFGHTISQIKQGLKSILTDAQLYQSLNSKPKIVKIDKKTFDIVAEYESRNECLANEGMDKASLSNVLSGKRKTYKGYAYKEVSNNKYSSFEEFVSSKPDYDMLIENIEKKKEIKSNWKDENIGFSF